MSLASALNAATSGLRTTQARIGVVSQNIANADSVGYTRRRMSPLQSLAGGETSGVRAGDVQRTLDLVAQRQLRLESSGAGYTDLRARFASSLERLFGQPGSAGSLDKAMNDYAASLQALESNPGDSVTRAAVVQRARELAGSVGAAAEGVQSLRTDAERRIGAIVERADGLLQALQGINAKMQTVPGGGGEPGLLDERDRLIDELSTLMDVNVSIDAGNRVRVATTGGQTLLDGPVATRLTFDARSALGPDQLYSADPAQRGVGTVLARTGSGAPVDLIERGAFRSGEIRAAIEMRDETLVQAQRQLDELAAGLAAAGTEARTEGVSAGTGYRLDVATANRAAGDAMVVSYLDAGGVRRDATVLVQGGGAPNLASSPDDPSRPRFNYALTSGSLPTAPFTITEGTDNISVGPSAGITLLGVSYARVGTLDGRGGTFPPLFTDRGSSDAVYGGVHPAGVQRTGLAQRLQVNPQVAAKPSTINGYAAPSGDATRATALFGNLTRAERAVPPAAGIGGGGATYAGSVADIGRRIVETQAGDAESAARLDEGQKIALAAIESRFAETAGVNIDEEMSQLVQLQTAYGANARVMTAVRDMLDMLMRM